MSLRLERPRATDPRVWRSADGATRNTLETINAPGTTDIHGVELEARLAFADVKMRGGSSMSFALWARNLRRAVIVRAARAR